MFYIQELTSLLAEAGLTNEETVLISSFSDVIVGFNKDRKVEDFDKEKLRVVIRKLKGNGVYVRYIKLLRQHSTDSMNDFYRYMDEEF